MGLEIDKALFCDKLDRMRIIWNNIMDFNPDGITERDLSELQLFAQFLKGLLEIRPQNRE